MLREELIAEYELFKEGVGAQCRSVDDMTDREMAGLHLMSAGDEAVHSFDGMEDELGVSPWSEARDLILQALDEPAPVPDWLKS